MPSFQKIFKKEEVSEVMSLKEVEAELFVSFLVWGFLQRR